MYKTKITKCKCRFLCECAFKTRNPSIIVHLFLQEQGYTTILFRPFISTLVDIMSFYIASLIAIVMIKNILG